MPKGRWLAIGVVVALYYVVAFTLPTLLSRMLNIHDVWATTLFIVGLGLAAGWALIPAIRVPVDPDGE
jgi:hypothetical protein